MNFADADENRADCGFGVQFGNDDAFYNAAVTDADHDVGRDRRDFYVDADKWCNSLAFCNDHRTDTKNDLKRGWYMAKVTEGDTTREVRREYKNNVEVCIALIEGEDFPRLFFCTTRPVKQNEELLLDYGAEFWRNSCIQKEQFEADTAHSGGADSQGSQASVSSQLSQGSSQGVRRNSSGGGLKRRNSNPLVCREPERAKYERLQREVVAAQKRSEEADAELAQAQGVHFLLTFAVSFATVLRLIWVYFDAQELAGQELTVSFQLKNPDFP